MTAIGPSKPTPTWQTKPTDRFVLKWIKTRLSARITPGLARIHWVEPWMITVCSALLGTLGGLVYGLGWGWPAGLMAAAAQVLDGVDGQLARLTHRQSRAGAFLDSVLDRYADGAMVIGLTVYLARLPLNWPLHWLLILGALAVIGSNLISYSSARAEALGLDTGPPTLASKGTRTTVLILGAWGSLFWPALPVLSLLYLVIHPNLVVIRRLIRAYLHHPPDRPPLKAFMPDQYGVVHGRFQILHNDHMKYLLAGRDRCCHLIVGITNPDPSRTRFESADPKRSRAEANPLTYFERHRLLYVAMIEAGLDPAEFSIVPLPISQPDLYHYYVPENATWYLTIYDDWGRRKLDYLRKAGLRTEVLWEKPASQKGITGHEVRRRMMAGESWSGLVPPDTSILLNEWNIPERLRRFIT